MTLCTFGIHDWLRWGPILKREYQLVPDRFTYLVNNMIHPDEWDEKDDWMWKQTYIKRFQQRECCKCGKLQERQIRNH